MLQNDKSYLPYSCSESDLDLYKGNLPLPVILAKLWNKHVPRGKSWLPRLIGRYFRKAIANHYIELNSSACLVIEPSSLDVYVHMLNHERAWDEHIFEVCKSYLHKGAVFYDIGANVGYFSLEMAKIFNDELSIFSFEPQTLLARSIALSSRLNGFNNLKIFDLMLGEKCGQIDLFIGSHSIHASSVPREKNSIKITKEMTTLDTMVRNRIIPPPNVIKMDVEGGEFAVLSGARETISTYLPYIIFESDSNMERFGYLRKNILDLITSMGFYDFFYIADFNGTMLPLMEDNLFGDINIVAIPNQAKL